MQFPQDQINELYQLFPGASRHEEGGCTYFFLPRLVLPEGCSPEQVDALLCPLGRDGYSSRLFFAQQIASRATPNWAQPQRILERQWYVFSWRVEEAQVRLAQLVGLHLRGLR